MAFRKKQPGKLVVEQTRDMNAVRALLTAGGLTTYGIEWPSACYLAAYLGSELVGVIGIEPLIDAALIRSFYVLESARGRGIGAELLSAARKAAHTRGARFLYLFSTEAGDYFKRFGFVEIPVAQLVAALDGVPEVEFYKERPDELAKEVAWFLDISRDGARSY